jgi:hypothetical protein
MTKLKLGTIEDDKPVKLTSEYAADVYRDLVAYAEAIGRESGQAAPDPAKVVPRMVERFMATDRAFARAQKRRAVS